MQISKKIAIIELQAHSEVFFHFAKLLNHTVELLLFTRSEIYQESPDELIGNTKNQWILIDENQSDKAFIKSKQSALNQCEAVIFVTIVRDFRFYANFQLSSKTILIVHNSRACLQPFKAICLQFSWSKDFLLDVLRVGKFFLFLEFFYKKKMIDNFDLLLFPTKIIRDFVIKNLKPSLQGKSNYLNFAYVENSKVLTNSADRNNQAQPIIITIPGTIAAEGRDYEMVVQAFKKVIPNLGQSIKLILAGRSKGQYGQEIIHQLVGLQNHHFEVLFFEQHIPQAEYEAILQITDFLILPLKKYVKYGIYQEINGVTKISGSVNDMIRFGLRGLVNKDYPLAEGIENNVIRYKNSNDLYLQVIDWVIRRKGENKIDRKELLNKYRKSDMQNQLLEIIF